ncbi:MAG: aminotransferase class V-fold PLP-dependent enzyme [Bacteroidales bacterium]|nr:aminotransferase class V-fold PLP-dependent enzyme [Bacteroidales bacterium]
MEQYFDKYRRNTIGHDLKMQSPYGEMNVLYADWVASGRLYLPIEQKIQEKFGPWVANTHTETSETGTIMTKSYHWAHQIIKNHVNANEDDILITSGNGMTGVINKFQRILGMKSCGILSRNECIHEEDKRPIVFITHMEHHSNQTSWLETNADVVVLEPNPDLTVNPEELKKQLEIYKNRKFKIGSFSSCSNVTGVYTDHHLLAKIMHQHGGLCFIDFAANAPYDHMNMHPEDPEEALDAIFFSPHKFLGGPGSSGVLLFNKELYANSIPDNPGGGTVDWTNPWGEYKYVDNIEAREDGGTPGFLQAIRIALAIKLKEEIGVDKIKEREDYLVKRAFELLTPIPRLKILSGDIKDRLGVFSFYMENIHYNLVVKILNDRFGIQVRGGCACAGTYGHFLMGITPEVSEKIVKKISNGDLSSKPGWVRLSLHPTMTNSELDLVATALRELSENIDEWEKDYKYNPKNNEFKHLLEVGDKIDIVKSWFEF